MLKKLNQLIAEFDIISDKMSDLTIINNIPEYTSLAKEHRRLTPVINKAKEYIKLSNESIENKELLLSADEELKELVKEDLLIINEKCGQLEDELKILLLPMD